MYLWMMKPWCLSPIEVGADPIPAPALSPEPSPAPDPTPDPTPAPEPRDEPPVDYVRVPKDQLAEHNGSWHEVMVAAKTAGDLKQFADLAAQNNMTTEELYAHITSEPSTAGTGPDGRAQPPTPTFDPDKLSESITKNVMGSIEQREQDQAKAGRKVKEEAYRSEAARLRTDVSAKLLTKLDIKPDDYRAGIIRTIAEQTLHQTIAESLKSDPRFAGQDLAEVAKDMIPLDTEQASAIEAAMKTWADLGNEFVAAGVAAQRGEPADTLGGGAGSPTKPPVNMDGWSKEEKAHQLIYGTRN